MTFGFYFSESAVALIIARLPDESFYIVPLFLPAHQSSIFCLLKKKLKEDHQLCFIDGRFTIRFSHQGLLSVKTRKGLSYIINLVFLPPKLPQKDDSDDIKSASLIEELRALLRSLQTHIPELGCSELIPCIKMINNMLELRDHVRGLVAAKVKTTPRKNY